MKWKLTARSNIMVMGMPLMTGQSIEYEGKTLPDDVKRWVDGGMCICEEVKEMPMEPPIESAKVVVKAATVTSSGVLGWTEKTEAEEETEE